MNLNDDLLKFEEKVAFSLRELYRRYGYTRYRMSRFEEYDLYARNKDFLSSDNIITFNDIGGRLMAMKPDMTMSIVRNTASTGKNDIATRVYYDENVYRVSPRTHSFAEIHQVGLECIGTVDDYCVNEVLSLAAESLAAISDDAVLQISHVGIVRDILNACTQDPILQEKILRCTVSKNKADLLPLLEEAGADQIAARRMIDLPDLDGEPELFISTFRLYPHLFAVREEYIDALDGALQAAKAAAPNVRVRINFSTAGDMRYYNGIVFRGYVKGVPESVLSGGRYDLLPEHMGFKADAIGFAVSLDSLELLRREKDYDVDILLLYGYDIPAADVAAAVRQLTDEGNRVSAQHVTPEGMRYRKKYLLDESGVYEA